MLLFSLQVVLSLALLAWSADRFVAGAASLARIAGISPLLIGLTIVAMGSSAPEILVAATASLSGQPDTAVGNAIGSNITNIALVLGITALLKPLQIASLTLRRELPIVLIVTVLALLLLLDETLTRLDGWLLLGGFVLVISGLVWLGLRARNSHDPMIEEQEAELPEEMPLSRAVFWLVVGLVLLPVSADQLVAGASGLARMWGMSDLVIGLTIIAIGTSLPELAASVASVMKDEDDLALGNIIGSNIFNLLAVMAMPGLLAPGALDPMVLVRDYPWMLGLTVVLVLFAALARKPRHINRFQGVLLLAAFIVYQLSLFYTHSS